MLRECSHGQAFQVEPHMRIAGFAGFCGAGADKNRCLPTPLTRKHTRGFNGNPPHTSTTTTICSHAGENQHVFAKHRHALPMATEHSGCNITMPISATPRSVATSPFCSNVSFSGECRRVELHATPSGNLIMIPACFQNRC
jgi:hypothetical protein